MVERCDLLDRYLLAGRLVHRGADDTVGALANNILDVVLLAHVEGDLARTALRRSARHDVGVVLSLAKQCVVVRNRKCECFEVVKCARAVAQQLGDGQGKSDVRMLGVRRRAER